MVNSCQVHFTGVTWYKGQPQHKLRRIACEPHPAQPKNLRLTGVSPRALYLRPVVQTLSRWPCRPQRNPKCHLRMLLVRITYGCAPAAKVDPGYFRPHRAYSWYVPVQGKTRRSAAAWKSPRRGHPTLGISTGTGNVQWFTTRHLTSRMRKTAKEIRCGSQLPRHQARLLTC